MLFQYRFSEYGKLCECIKLDFLVCLGSIDKLTYINPEIDASIIDGPALVQMNHPESSLKAFGSYCEVQLVNKVNSFFQNTNYISVAFNMYQENSLNNDTLESRDSGEGTQTLARHDIPIQHKNFKDFLRVNNNKTELFKMITDVVTCKCE